MTDMVLHLMKFYLFVGGVVVLVFFGSLFLLRLGRRTGQRFISKHGQSSLVGFNVVEGAVFALMGLILAFSLSGALQRFDERRSLILQEMVAIQTTADRIELMEPAIRDRLREKLGNYLEARMAIFRGSMDLSILGEYTMFDPALLRAADQRRAELWKDAAAQCPFGISVTGCALFLPALTEAFEAAALRKGANERHPPQIVFVMLFGLSLAASLLAGFSMAAAKSASYLHALIFSTSLAVLIYIISDIEFPRLGLIRVDYMDHFLQNLLDRIREG